MTTPIHGSRAAISGIPIRRMAAILATVWLTGCFGISIQYPASFEYDYRDEPRDFTPRDDATDYQKSLSTLQRMERHYSLYNVDQEDRKVESLAPDTERFSYRPRLLWAGIRICFLIPIPVLIPVGVESYSFDIRNELLVAERARFSRDTFCGIGYVLGVKRAYWQVGCGPYFRRPHYPTQKPIEYKRPPERVLDQETIRAIRTHVEMLKSPDYGTRQDAIVFLAHEIGFQAIPYLVREDIVDDKHRARGAAIQTIKRIHWSGGPWEQPLVDALQSSSASIRVFAAFNLATIGAETKNAVHALLAALRDESPMVRSIAAHGLRSIDPESDEAVDALILALSDPDPSVRGSAAIALGQIGPRALRAEKHLKALLDDPEDFVARFARTALERLSDLE